MIGLRRSDLSLLRALVCFYFIIASMLGDLVFIILSYKSGGMGEVMGLTEWSCKLDWPGDSLAPNFDLNLPAVDESNF